MFNFLKKRSKAQSNIPITVEKKDGYNKNSNSNEGSGDYVAEYRDTNLFIRGNSESGYFITFNMYTVSEPQKTIADCEQLIRTRNWSLIMGVACALFELSKNLDNDKAASKTLETITDNPENTENN